MPLDGAALLKTAIKSLKKDDEDIDGIPSKLIKNNFKIFKIVEIKLFIFFILVDDIDGEPIDDDYSSNRRKTTGAFVPSKWETVDPEQIEAQAMTTSKWDLLEPPQQVKCLLSFKKKNFFWPCSLILKIFGHSLLTP